MKCERGGYDPSSAACCAHVFPRLQIPLRGGPTATPSALSPSCGGRVPLEGTPSPACPSSLPSHASPPLSGHEGRTRAREEDRAAPIGMEASGTVSGPGALTPRPPRASRKSGSSCLPEPRETEGGRETPGRSRTRRQRRLSSRVPVRVRVDAARRLRTAPDGGAHHTPRLAGPSRISSCGFRDSARASGRQNATGRVTRDAETGTAPAPCGALCGSGRRPRSQGLTGAGLIAGPARAREQGGPRRWEPGPRRTSFQTAPPRLCISGHGV